MTAGTTRLETAFAAAVYAARPVTEATAQYVALFWTAYLGAPAVAVWRILAAVAEQGGPADYLPGAWPSIAALAALCGPGVTRHTLLGRAAGPGRRFQEGILPRLERERIARARPTGDGPAALRYVFEVRPALPLLAPVQAETLLPSVRDLHDRWLIDHDVSPRRWRRDRRPTFLPPWEAHPSRLPAL
jgi:hypothetical protein